MINCLHDADGFENAFSLVGIFFFFGLLLLFLLIQFELTNHFEYFVFLLLFKLVGLFHFLFVDTVFVDGSLKVFTRVIRFQIHSIFKHHLVEEDSLFKVVLTRLSSLRFMLSHILNLRIDILKHLFFLLKQLRCNFFCKSFRNRLCKVFLLHLLVDFIIFCLDGLFVFHF